MARISPPLPYFHSPSSEDWRNSCQPPLHNMSLHEALQLRDTLRDRVRALHTAHTDALEGLRRRQWELERQRQEQELHSSTHPSEWTRQQYEEMQPLQDEQQYEVEQEEEAASQTDSAQYASAGVPLTVPSLDSYWYERSDSGFCEQLRLYNRCLADLDRVFFS